MSKVGKKIITVPEGVKPEIKEGIISITGPRGTLNFPLRPEISVQIVDSKIVVKANEEKGSKALHGTTRQVIANMITGVNQGWSKTLEVIGTGFRANLEEGKLVLSIGFSHKIVVPPPPGIIFSVADNKITVSGADKTLVGKVAAGIRQFRPPDAYKGKGIRYEGERIKLKPGKAAKVAAGIPK